MQYEDRVAIPTPEGVEVELTLAGVGSRFVASLIDHTIKLVAIIVLIIALFGLGALFGSRVSENTGWVAVVIYFIVIFLISFAYDVAFETLAAGRTPGKRWVGLRVVKVGGTPVGFMTSVTRNLLRIVDSLPGAYGVGMISVLVTRLNQRLGDLAAGTVVIRDRPRPAAGTVTSVSVPPTAQMSDELSTWDVSSVSPQDLVAIRRFLDRRHGLAPAARAHLAAELAGKLRGKVGGAPDMHPESFLECVSVAKAHRA